MADSVVTSGGSSIHWQPDFERLLQAAKGRATHGHLVDVRETLRQVISRDRPLVMLCPHADDGAITAALRSPALNSITGMPLACAPFLGRRYWCRSLPHMPEAFMSMTTS